MAVDRPNVLVLFTDDQRFDTIAALGNRQIQTPTLDALAARGTVFTQASIMGGTVGAVCMPSRAMLHTGRGLFRFTDHGAAIPPAYPMLGELFRAAGYRTFGTGKWHNGTEAYHRSFTDGAEIFFGGMADHWNVPACHYDPKGVYGQVHPFCKDAFASNQLRHQRCDHLQPGVHSTDLLSDAAIQWLEGYEDPAPFLAYVSFLAPHDPRTMPEEFLKRYDPEAIELPPNFLPEHPFDNGVGRGMRDEALEAFPRTPEAVRRHIAEYYAMITHLDARIGAILETLERAGRLENTIVLFAGDNGLAVGQHGLMGKQNLYDHSIRVPLILAGPGVPAGARRDALCYLYDILPTVCELAGPEGPDAPAGIDGRSLVPQLAGGAPLRETAYHAYAQSQRAVRDGRMKLYEIHAGATWTTRLFDLEADPWETRDLSTDPAHAETLGRLRAEMLRWAEASGDRAHETGKAFYAGWPHGAA